MKNWITYLLVLVTYQTVGQSINTLANYDVDTLKAIGTFGEVQYNSRVITNQFARAFFNGEYLSNELKSNTINSLADANIMGLDMNYGLYSSFELNNFSRKKSSHYSIFIGLYDREHIDMNVPGDLFKLVFSGNKQFAGQHLNIGGFEYNEFHYQQFQLGFLKNNRQGEKIGFAVSYLNGQKYLSYSIPELNFFTSEIGDVINTSWDLRYTESDPTKKKFGSINGYGLSSQFFYQYDYGRDSSRTNYFRFEISDLGFINWNDKSYSIQSKDSINYSGYYISNIADIHDTVIRSITVDSLKNRYSYSKTEKVTTYLPANIHLSLQQYHSQKLASTVGLLYRTNANFNPYFYFEEKFQLISQISLSGRIAYGGYGKLALGLRSEIQLNGINITIGTNNLEAAFASKKVGAFSIYGGLQYRF